MELTILPGDVWGRGIVSDVIEQVTRGPSHVALFLTLTKLEETQGGRTAGECDLSFYTHSDAHLEVWGDPSLTEEERAQMVEFAHTLYGKRYDYVLIPLEFLHAKFGLPLGWYHNDDALICSDDVAACAESVGREWSLVPNPLLRLGQQASAVGFPVSIIKCPRTTPL